MWATQNRQKDQVTNFIANAAQTLGNYFENDTIREINWCGYIWASFKGIWLYFILKIEPHIIPTIKAALAIVTCSGSIGLLIV